MRAAAVAQAYPGARFRAWAQITRLSSCLAAMGYTYLGAYLAGGFEPLLEARVLHAALVVGLVVAFGCVINDYRDVVGDGYGKPQRPLPSGRITLRQAGIAAVALPLVALGLAAPLGPVMLVFALGTVLLSAAYSLYLKGTLLLGNAAVAVLNATIIPYGALAAGGITAAAWAASALILLFTFSQEILYTVEDEKEDRLAGLRTTATRIGADVALALYRVLALVFVAAALAPWFLGIASDRYLYAIVLCTVLPTLVVVLVLAVRVSERTIHFAVYLTWYVWFTSFLPLALLR